MLGRTHLLFGIFLCTFFTQPLVWVIILLSSLIPDIDIRTSLLGRKVKIIGSVFEHRGFFHSLFFFIPASILMYAWNTLYGFAFILGMGGHLILDMMTKQGLRLFPFKKKIKGVIKVGSSMEKLFVFFLIILIIFRFFILL